MHDSKISHYHQLVLQICLYVGYFVVIGKQLLLGFLLECWGKFRLKPGLQITVRHRTLADKNLLVFNKIPSVKSFYANNE